MALKVVHVFHVHRKEITCSVCRPKTSGAHVAGFFFGKHPFSFAADALDLSAATELILQNLFLRYMFPHVYRMALGLDMKKVNGDQVSHTTVLAQWHWE